MLAFLLGFFPVTLHNFFERRGKMKPKPTLEDAIILATRLHKGQVDKRKEPYILHPLAVMLDGKTDKERIVGVLHDVLEDTKVTVVKLRTLGYSKEILDALKILTKRPDEKDNYLSFIRRIKESRNELAHVVKIRDIENNIKPSRFPENPTEKDFARKDKYEKALELLSGSKPKSKPKDCSEIKNSEFWGPGEFPDSRGEDDFHH